MAVAADDPRVVAWADFLRNQYNTGQGGSGSWDDAGYDRAVELGQLFVNAGVETPGDLSLKDVTGPIWTTDDTAYGIDAPPASMYWKDGVLGQQLMVGDTPVGYLGDYNNDGTFGSKASDYLGGNGDENLLGWSARGDGNTSYRVITDPNTGKLVIAPGWNSSSDAGDFQNAAKFFGTTAALGYGLTNLLGTGAATGGEALTGWDAAMADAAASGAIPQEMYGAAGLTGWDAAMADVAASGAIPQEMYGVPSLIDPTVLTAPEQIPPLPPTPTIPNVTLPPVAPGTSWLDRLNPGTAIGAVAPLLDSSGSDGTSGSNPYSGPMPTISRDGWAPSATPKYMDIPVFGADFMAQQQGNKDSGLWRFMGSNTQTPAYQPPSPGLLGGTMQTPQRPSGMTTQSAPRPQSQPGLLNQQQMQPLVEQQYAQADQGFSGPGFVGTGGSPIASNYTWGGDPSARILVDNTVHRNGAAGGPNGMSLQDASAQGYYQARDDATGDWLWVKAGQMSPYDTSGQQMVDGSGYGQMIPKATSGFGR